MIGTHGHSYHPAPHVLQPDAPAARNGEAAEGRRTRSRIREACIKKSQRARSVAATHAHTTPLLESYVGEGGEPRARALYDG